MQRVLVFGASRYDHVTPILQKLKWLPVRKRIDRRLSILSFLSRKELAPAYLSSELMRVSTLTGRKRLRSTASDSLILPDTRP